MDTSHRQTVFASLIVFHSHSFIDVSLALSSMGRSLSLIRVWFRWDSKNSDKSFISDVNFHVNQFVERSERARAVSESELMNALQRSKVIKNKFVVLKLDAIAEGEASSLAASSGVGSSDKLSCNVEVKS